MYNIYCRFCASDAPDFLEIQNSSPRLQLLDMIARQQVILYHYMQLTDSMFTAGFVLMMCQDDPIRDYLLLTDLNVF